MPYGYPQNYRYPTAYKKGGSAAVTPFALIASSSIGATPPPHDAVTSGIDTSGATLLVVAVATYNGGATGAASVTDSKGNTWTALTSRESTDRVQIFYAKNPTVGTGHTFTASTTSGYPSAIASAFSQSDLAAPFDVENGGSNAASTTLATGSITPSQANSLVIAAVAADSPSSTASIDSGFTLIANVTPLAGNHIQCAMAYKVQTSAAAVNPTWTLSGSSSVAAAIASFKHS